MKTLVFTFIGSALGAAAGMYAYNRFVKKKGKCNCQSTTTTAPAAGSTAASSNTSSTGSSTNDAGTSTTPAAVSQPIAANIAATMGMDGWRSPY